MYIFFCLFKKKEVSSYIFITIFLVLSLLTIYGSPRPSVDTFVIIKEAPLKLLQGQNPYNSIYSQVYKGVEPNYYNYLPLSIVYFLPFVYFFNDPRFGIVFAMVAIYLLMNRLQKKNAPQKHLLSSLFLFAPRSFYMIEHVYLDTLIFFFFILSSYFFQKSKNKLFSLTLSCFFSLKQNMIILIPIFIDKLIKKKENMLFFLIPFLLIALFMAWNPQRFIMNTLIIYKPSNELQMVAPLQTKIVIPNMIFQIFHPSSASMQVIFKLCIAVMLIISLLVILDKKLDMNKKIVLILFFSCFFSYHAYFNSYYLVLLFLFFDFVLSKKQSILKV